MGQPFSEDTDMSWKSFYGFGAVSALGIVAIALLDIVLSFLPGGGNAAPGAHSAAGWFDLLRSNWFMGLRNLGLLNIVNTTLMVPVFLALYAAHRRVHEAYALFAAVLLFIGTAVYIAQNTAFSMLALSGQYAAAAESQKAQVLAAGQAVLAHSEDLSPGTFMGFCLSEIAGIVISLVMLRGRVFGAWTAWTGILGEGSLLGFNVFTAFIPAQFGVALAFAGIGGPLSMVWLVLIARRLFRLGRESTQDSMPGTKPS